MAIFGSHRLRHRTIAAAQAIHTAQHPNHVGVQRDMRELFASYLDKKPPTARLDKAQALLNRHVVNRTSAERRNFSASLLAVCAARDERVDTARTLATLCHFAKSLARDQWLADCLAHPDMRNPKTLAKTYQDAFSSHRVDAALIFYLARNLSAVEMRQVAAFLQHPQTLDARKRVADILADTPEAHPQGIDLTGRSLANIALEHSPLEAVPGIPPEQEARVRKLLEAAWAPAVSHAGMQALCGGLEPPRADWLQQHMSQAAYQRFMQACARFAETLPGVPCEALHGVLGEALRDHMSDTPGRRRGALPTP